MSQTQKSNKLWLLNDLNPNQKKAVLNINGPLAIIAGAGSGKTKTLTKKIAYLINDIGISPERLLAVTFTNKAANEMKERVVSLIGEIGHKTNIMTYHSFCSKVLREEISFFGFDKTFSIIDTLDQKQILRGLYEKHKLTVQQQSINSFIDFISRHKILNTNPKEDKYPVSHQNKLIKIFNDYNLELKKTNSLDFDDLIIYVNRLFKQSIPINQKWSNMFDYILVDEFQDTSLIQYEIIESIASKNNITIVGDPDQTIYTWRWADVNLINNFQNYFPKSKIIKLEQNYRSTPNILNAANALISFNKNRIHKNLFTENKQGEDIEYYHAFSDDMECKWIISKIIELKKQKVQLKSIVILYRSSFVSRPIERALLENNINHIIFDDVAFYSRAEVKDVLAFLKVIYNGNDIALMRIINIPSRGLGKTTLARFQELANQEQISILDSMQRNFDKVKLMKNQKQELANFINLIRKYKLALRKYPINVVIKKFLIECNYIKMHEELLDKNRIDNIEELITSIADWEKKNPKKNLDDYFNDISLLSSSNNQGVMNDYISLMTIHAAKGLEFPYVFLMGFSEPIFPSARTIDFMGESGLEEERRLAYVAITRAMKKLFISSSQGRYIDQKLDKRPSRFLRQMKIQNKTKFFDFSIIKSNNDKDNSGIKIGNKIRHLVFGDGIVIKASKDQLEIQFNTPYGIKTLMRNHKSIERID